MSIKFLIFSKIRFRNPKVTDSLKRTMKTSDQTVFKGIHGS